MHIYYVLYVIIKHWFDDAGSQLQELSTSMETAREIINMRCSSWCQMRISAGIWTIISRRTSQTQPGTLKMMRTSLRATRCMVRKGCQYAKYAITHSGRTGLHSLLMHASSAGINGFLYGNLPSLSICQGNKIHWHLFGLGNEVITMMMMMKLWNVRLVDYMQKVFICLFNSPFLLFCCPFKLGGHPFGPFPWPDPDGAEPPHRHSQSFPRLQRYSWNDGWQCWTLAPDLHCQRPLDG